MSEPVLGSEESRMMRSIGARIRRRRMARRRPQHWLGSLVGVSPGEISKIENGARKVSVLMVRRIAQALSISVGELLGDSVCEYNTDHGELQGPGER